MDYVVLCITRYLVGIKKGLMRSFIAATIGGLWAVISVCLVIKIDHIKPMINWITYTVIIVFMWSITVGRRKLKLFFRDIVILWAVTFCLAGIGHFLWYDSAFGYTFVKSRTNTTILLATSLVGVVIHCMLHSIIDVHRKYGDKIYKVRITINNQSVEMDGLFDSGNVLRDPYSGRQVHVVCAKCLNEILGESSNLELLHYRLIPFCSVGEQKGLLPVIDVESFEVLKNNQVLYKDEASIGLYNGELTGNGCYEALLNSGIFD